MKFKTNPFISYLSISYSQLVAWKQIDVGFQNQYFQTNPLKHPSLIKHGNGTSPIHFDLFARYKPPFTHRATFDDTGG